MGRSLLALVVFLSSSAGFAQFMDSRQLSAESLNAINCNMAINQALSNGFAGGSAPIVVGLDGKVSNVDQVKIVSRETKGDKETIVYKEKQIVGYKDGKPVFETVRSTVVLNRVNGQIVSIEKPQDLKRQAAMRAEAKKKFNNIDYKLIKSFETSFKSTGGNGCQTEQKILTLTQDEKGKQVETFVNYDADFCERIKPAIDRVGLNNAAECGSFLSIAEKALTARKAELQKEGKKFQAALGIDDSVNMKQQVNTMSLSLAVSDCIREARGGYPDMGMGMFGVYGMVSHFAPTEAPEPIPVPTAAHDKPTGQSKKKQGTR